MEYVPFLKTKRRKIQYHATRFVAPNGKKTIQFKGSDGSHIHWAGGSIDTPNAVIRKLVEIHGKSKGLQIYSDFNQALLAISEGPSEFPIPYSCLVLYKNDADDTKEKIVGMNTLNEEVHSE